jgi:hypothetical protein
MATKSIDNRRVMDYSRRKFSWTCLCQNWFSFLSTLCACMLACACVCGYQYSLRMVQINYKFMCYLSFYRGAFSDIHVKVTDGYYKSGDNHGPIITEAVNVKCRTDFNLRWLNMLNCLNLLKVEATRNRCIIRLQCRNFIIVPSLTTMLKWNVHLHRRNGWNKEFFFIFFDSVRIWTYVLCLNNSGQAINSAMQPPLIS